MALLAPNLNYTDKDFDALKARLQALIRSVFPTWTDYNVANFGNILLELFAYVGDTLTFYQDGQARESRIITATQRKNLINLVKLIGYRPRGVTAAQAVETFTLSVVPAQNVTFHAGDIVATGDVTDPVEFQILADFTINAGTSPPTATATIENSVSRSESFASSGLPNQSFKLSRTPYVDNSATITASNGSYTQVDNFLDSTPSDRHFSISIDQNDQATILFGNGTNGAIPVGTIDAEYKSGGGSRGMVEAGAIKRMTTTVYDALGAVQTVTVTNAAKSTGGLDRESMPSIQLRAPQSLRSETRSITNPDFQTNALRVAGVSRALMVNSDDDPAVAENTGILYIVPTTGTVATDALKASVLYEVTVTRPQPLTFQPFVQSAPFLTLNLRMVAHFKQGTNRAAAAAAIRKALFDFMKPNLDDGTPNPNVGFGAEYVNENGIRTGVFPLSDLFEVANDVAGVRSIGGAPQDFTINGAHTDIPIQPRQFPSLGSVVIIDGDTGALL